MHRRRREEGRLLGTPSGAVPVLVRSPVCSMKKHCGWKAELGAPVKLGGCINTPITCTHCGATGIRSERTDQL